MNHVPAKYSYEIGSTDLRIWVDKGAHAWHSACMSTAEAQRKWRARHGARTGVRGKAATSPCGTLAAHKRHVRHHEPPCELCRLAARADRGFRRNKGAWQRSDRFSWLLHRIVLDELLTDPLVVVDGAIERLETQRRRPGAGVEAALWDRWADLLAGPINDLAAVMIGLDEDSKQLRSTTPFIGIIDEARRTSAFEASRAI